MADVTAVDPTNAGDSADAPDPSDESQVEIEFAQATLAVGIIMMQPQIFDTLSPE
jgi:hypothetical protein